MTKLLVAIENFTKINIQLQLPNCDHLARQAEPNRDDDFISAYKPKQTPTKR